MPELPDLTLYVDALRARVVGQPLESLRLRSPFLLRTADPPIDALAGRAVETIRRLGKQLVFAFDGDLHLALHLMIAGRLHWTSATAKGAARAALATWTFPTGVLTLTEAGSHRRASLHLVRGPAGLAALDRGGLEVLDAPYQAFREALRRESHTLKRALTDPRLLSGIGNAYSDEILFAARLSPVKLTRALTDAELQRLHDATLRTLEAWIERLRAETGASFPEKVTAFRPEMAMHGKYRQPCPACRTPIQRIVQGEHECNYCPTCQTGGKLLADRALSRLLRQDWPRTIDELEHKKAGWATGLTSAPRRVP